MSATDVTRLLDGASWQAMTSTDAVLADEDLLFRDTAASRLGVPGRPAHP
jgi:hypothetical protein